MGKSSASAVARAPKPQAIRASTPAIPDLWIQAGLLLATALVYFQVRAHTYITLDDLGSEWVLGPMVRRGVTLQGLWWALTSMDDSWWFPLTRLSHMLDVQLFGVDAGAAHLVSVAIHAASSLLLFRFFKRATGDFWPSAFVAFVFAMHPLRVESVAWIAERKDVLCTFFFVAALCAYLRYVERPGRWRYLVVAALCAFALMSKSMAASLPCVLVLLDFWPLKRNIRFRDSVVEKLPLFVLAAVGGYLEVYAVRHGATVNHAVALPLRVENALIRYIWYLVKAVWPVNLAVFYPFPTSITLWQPIVATILLLAATGLVVVFRRHRYLAVGWFWYLGTISLVIGIVQSGWQAWADRYMYIPMIGLSICVTWGAMDLLRRWPKQQNLAAAAAIAACLLMSAATYNQLQYWQNSETLFLRALAVTERNVMAHDSLGEYYLDTPGRLPEAAAQFEKAIAIDPQNEIAHNDLGVALLRTPGGLEQALPHLEAAVRIKPAYFEAHNNLAAAYLRTPGGGPAAVHEFESALAIRPNSAEVHYNLGATLENLPGRLPDAVVQFQTALQISPDFDSHYALATALAQIPGKRVEAAAQLQAALRLRPESQEARQLLRRLMSQ